VSNACTAPRADGGDTWLVPEMISAYRTLHVHGIAHAVEVWQDDTLADGPDGVAIGGICFGKSVFTHVDNASKVALVHLSHFLNSRGFALIDRQVLTGHLLSPGAEQIPRPQCLRLLEQDRDQLTPQVSRDAGDIAIPGAPRAADVAAEVRHAR